MPTVEERLAALEARMDAWMDQQPTNYYPHQYSGEEIDNAVARALPNGAIDQAVGTFVRPNLLDNAYFGNPVDQRGGYVVPPGVAYGGASSGTTTKYYPVKSTYIYNDVKYAVFDVDGSECNVPFYFCVRGYTGNGYTVDRWGILNNVTATLQNASLNIAYTESGWNLYTFLDNVLMPGTTYTLSCLYKASGNPIRLVCTWGTNKFFYNEQAPISDDWTLAEITGTIPADATIDENEIVVQSLGSGAGNFSLKAIKLELGPTQTLAHKEGEKWVLNEVPEYGDQLRRCQRYCVDITPSLIFNTMYSGFLSTTGCDFLVPIPVTLRESGSAPVVICNPAEWQVAVVAANAYFTPTSISVSQTASGAIMLRCLFSNSLPGQYCDLRKAVDSAKLILSKDL